MPLAIHMEQVKEVDHQQQPTPYGYKAIKCLQPKKKAKWMHNAEVAEANLLIEKLTTKLIVEGLNPTGQNWHGLKPAPSVVVGGGRVRFMVQMNPRETTIVSWIKHLKEVNLSEPEGPDPSAPGLGLFRTGLGLFRRGSFEGLLGSDNQISGTIPSLSSSSIEIIDLSYNQFSGHIPLFPANAVNIQLSGNKFSGTISSICKTSHNGLMFLDRSNNQLVGKVPDCWEKLPNLHSLNLASNKFSGEIPPSLGNLQNSVALQMHGKESGYKTNLEFLKLIDFSSNRLKGNIPKSFSNMKELNSLNLSRNSLSGSIIPDIGKMEMLDSLDLSQNQLSGKIPTSLAEIYTLGFLDLSNNSLFGKIPTSTQLQSFSASAYAGNNGLCGDPLPKCTEDSLRPSTTNPPDNMNEKDNNSFFLMQEVDISMVFGFIIGLWEVVGSFVLKKSWRDAFFNWLDVAGDWFYVKGGVLVSKFRPS
ncbi:receptor-like protein EIX2 [Salvia hispanica]|uniref:receptor-like protein EIX2 n=1 Tax=Salvia hispanica TaxID=49212 RepID=UPI0020098E0D|nr:receptor-like protein EIX2 [Salvia hispanica]